MILTAWVTGSKHRSVSSTERRQRSENRNHASMEEQIVVDEGSVCVVLSRDGKTKNNNTRHKNLHLKPCLTLPFKICFQVVLAQTAEIVRLAQKQNADAL